MKDDASGLIWRLGSVPYLNARPLVVGAPASCHFAVPSELSSAFADGHFDAALLPVFEALRRDQAVIADEICIACDGPVFSVFLAYQGELENLDSVALDPASRTSSHLLQVIFREFLGLSPTFHPAPDGVNQARLLIGDAAIAFRRRDHTATGWKFLDLGEAWKAGTGLPFVFAVWLLRRGLDDASHLARYLRKMKDVGLAQRRSIIRGESDPDFADNYLHRSIRYNLGPNEKAGIALFAELLRKCGLIPLSAGNDLHFV